MSNVFVKELNIFTLYDFPIKWFGCGWSTASVYELVILIWILSLSIYLFRQPGEVLNISINLHWVTLFNR